MTTDLPRCGEVVGFDSDAHTITLRVETMPDGLAIGDRLHGPRPALSDEDVEALRAIEPYLSEDYDAGCITTAYRDAIDRYRAALGRVLAGATDRPRPAPEVVETLARMAKQADAMGFDKQAGALRAALAALGEAIGMTRATILARQRAARSKRAHKRGLRFQVCLSTRKSAGFPVDDWLARHIGQLVQRVEELEVRVARLEGKR